MKPLRWFCGAVLAATMTAALPAALAAEMVYHRGNTGDPETLDQHKTSTIYEANILRDLYEGLVAYNAAGEIIPGVAESWDVSEDGKVYTFHFRDDAEWSNGEPVTPQDFVFSFRRIMTPETGAKYATILYPIKNAEKISTGELDPSELGVRAVDDATLEITLEAPTAYFIDLLGHQTGLPVNQAAVEEHASDFVKPGNMVSNGPYMLQEAVPNAQISVVKNPHYHDAENVAIDKVVFYPTEDRSAALRRFTAGEIHSNNDAPVEQVKWMHENLGEQFRVAPYLGTYYFTIKSDKEPFDDARVRRALSMVIDRRFLAEEIWGGTMIPAYSLVPPGIPSYGEPSFVDYRDESVLDREDEAIALLEEAGYGPDSPIEVEIRYNTSENHKSTALAIADMWKPLGVKVSLVNTDVATHYALLRDKGDYDVARAGWIGDYADAQNFLFLLESNNPGFNYASYSNPEFDGLMKKAAGEADPEKRSDYLHEAEAIVMQDEPYIVLLYYGSLSMVSDTLKGWEDNILNIHPSRWMSVEE